MRRAWDGAQFAADQEAYKKKLQEEFPDYQIRYTLICDGFAWSYPVAARWFATREAQDDKPAADLHASSADALAAKIRRGLCSATTALR